MTPSDYLRELEKRTARLVYRLAATPVTQLFGRDGSQRVQAGSSPGTLQIATHATPPRLKAVHFTADGLREIEDPDLDTLRALREQPGGLWLDVAGWGDARLLAELKVLFKVHDLAMADLVNRPQRPKADTYGDRQLIITHMPHLDEAGTGPSLGQLGLLKGPDFLLSVRESGPDPFEPILKRLRHPDSRIRREPVDYLAYTLLDLAVDAYFPVVEAMVGQIDALEDEVLEGRDRRLLQGLHRQRRGLIMLGRILWRQRDMIGQLLRGGDEFFRHELQVYLRDVHDHAVQLMDLVETARDLVGSLVEIHLTTVNNRLSQVMTTLTIMASIFIPLTFVVGIYGMNFEYMPELTLRWGYPAIMLVMLGIALGLLLWFYRRGWIGQPPDR